MLSEDLAKQDTAFESSANKLVDIIRSLLGAEAATKLAGSLSVNESKFFGLGLELGVFNYTEGIDGVLTKKEIENYEVFLVCLEAAFTTG